MLAKLLPGLLLATLVAGGAAAGTIPNFRAAASVDFDPEEFGFDDADPASVEWAQTESAALIDEISQETRLAIRLIVALIIAEGIAPGEAARLARPMLGLTTRGATAVLNLRRTLTDPRNFGRRVVAGRVPIRVPRTGLPLAQLERTLNRYTRQLLNQRAATIARTETIRAANEGQRQMWLQAQARGLLPATVQRVWVVTPDDRLCTICAGLENDIAIGLTGLFSNGLLGPPAHPNCRCATTLEIVRQERRA